MVRNGFEFLMQVESKTSQFEILFKSLARFSTQFRVKKVLLLYKLRKFVDKSRDSLAATTPLNFSGPSRRVRTSRLTNPSACTNLRM